jgi:hypothetical protein
MMQAIIGFWLGFVAVALIPGGKVSGYDEAISQCERENNLTENQECVISAKVVSK